LAGFAHRKRDNKPLSIPNIFTTIFVFTLPALVIILRSPSPFPRVFFSFWPIWLYIAGSAARWEESKSKKNIGNKPTPSITNHVAKFAIIVTTVILWGIFTALYAPGLSKMFTKKHSQDDFFTPYFMKKSFTPLHTVNYAIELTKNENTKVFLSQNCDFPSIIFYGKLKGVPDSFWLFDSPEKTAKPFSKESGEIYLVVRNNADLSLISERFKLGNIVPVTTKGIQKIYKAKLEK
jgi:hypothetical protein